jgi:site-specific DNA-methyltransferase (adenine-specific)
VSRNQIIWGCNYMPVQMPGPGRIIWDKCNDGSDQSNCEIAYISTTDRVIIFRYMWRGFMQGRSITQGHIQQGNKALNEVIIHPNQKPINLYRWIRQNFIRPGDLVLDTHVGSASSLIAYEEAGIDYIGYENHSDIYAKSLNRLESWRMDRIQNPQLFNPNT